MKIDEFILYTYADQLLKSFWVPWNEEIFNQMHPKAYNTPVGFQEIVGRNNSNNRTRATEFYRIGLLKGPLVNPKDGPRNIMPRGWELIQNDINIQTRLGYFSFVIGKTLSIDNYIITNSFNAICALFALQMGLEYNGRFITYFALFEKLKLTFRKPIDIDESTWLRYLAAGMFSTIKSNTHCNTLLSCYISGSPIKSLVLTWDDNTETVITQDSIKLVINDKNKSLTNITPKKHFLFWIGGEGSLRGIYSNASITNYNFIQRIAEIEWDSIAHNQKSPFTTLLNKNALTETPCVFEELNNISTVYTNLKETLTKIMKDIYNGVNESLSILGESNVKLTNDLNTKNLIFFGPPGTGKSHQLEHLINGKNVFQATFHSDYSYHDFVGGYKPCSDDNGKIKYEFVPQVFTAAYMKAWETPNEPVYLQIEEINRGNCAEIFGDLFQLLDRSSDGSSRYTVNASTELVDFLEKSLSDDAKEAIAGGKLKLPKNLSIFATMNTSDQSLFPMDTAFKRRWEWKYVPIDYTCNESDFLICLDSGSKYRWLDFLKNVNKLIFDITESQDKQLGNWFMNAKHTNNEISQELFLNKVFFYLWNDVFKDEKETIFMFNGRRISFGDFYVQDVSESKIIEDILENKLNMKKYSDPMPSMQASQ